MTTAREAAYAALRASAPRPVIAGDAVEAFGARFAAQNGSWARLGSPADVPAWLQARFAPPDGDTLAVATSADELLSALPWAHAPRLRHAPAPAQPRASLAVSTAFAGIAETGALALYPRIGAPMALNFLPDRLVIVVRAADIVATLDDFWVLVRARFGNGLPRGLCLAAGPSTSADVAMTFATGVHGPVELHALVV
ncbi:MAG: LUD domain-containing protein [Pseudomonadales bacterium]|nr:LUD domain-containing protein [Pseudomonadales bacterium]MBP9034238.1 LUD domain-containing protein [Pseudomonadales bacterium]